MNLVEELQSLDVNDVGRWPLPFRIAVIVLVFLVVALASSNLASRLRQETERLRRREREMQHLYEFSKRLAACFTISDLIDAVRHYLARTLGHRAALYVASADGHFESSPGSAARTRASSTASARVTRTRARSRSCRARRTRRPTSTTCS